MDEKTYKKMNMQCSCGHVSRTIAEEAKHRHNFPALCRKPKVLPIIKRKSHKR